MKTITITRQYGAGAGELAKKLASALGWELLDRDWLHRAAQIENLPDAELERLDEKSLAMTDRLRSRPHLGAYLHGIKTAASEAAQRGNVILVGRGARHLIGETPGVLHLRLVAPKDHRARRLAAIEGCTLERSLARCTEMDRSRERFHRYFFGAGADRPAEYDLVFNTARVPLDDMTEIAAAIVRETLGDHGTPAEKTFVTQGSRVLTISRELGAGERGLPRSLGDRLGMQVYDRELLEQQAVRLGVPESALEKIDEQPPGIFERFRPGSIYQRYRDALEKSMHELADLGDVILVGRGGRRFLDDDPRAFHLRLVAPMPVRVRRVMEFHWVRENVAKKRIAESDANRSSFYESYFGADWSSPVEYDMTVNSGRLGAAAVEVVVLAADRHWIRAQSAAGPHETR